MNGIVIRLAGVANPATKVFHQDEIRIGTAAECEIVLPTEPAGASPSSLAAETGEPETGDLVAPLPPVASHARLPEALVLLVLRLTAGVYRVAKVAPEANLVRDGEPVMVGEVLHDGATFYFGETGVRLRFFALSEATELNDSLGLGAAMLAHMRPVARQLGLRRREKTALVVPPSTALTNPDAASADTTSPSNNALPSGTISAINPAINPALKPLPDTPIVELSDAALTMPRTDVAILFVKQLARELVSEIPRRWLYVLAGVAALLLITVIYVPTIGFLTGQQNQHAIGQLNKNLEDTKKELNGIKEELRKASDNSMLALSSVSFASRVVEQYGESVCLIYGLYTFYDARAGRDVRFREFSESNNPINANGGLNLSADGSGRVYETEFIGTGFVVEQGLILTNRHVVYPWEEDPAASMIRAQGFKPRIKEMFAYFPKVHQPFALKQLDASSERDVALCGFEQGEARLPVLPLDERDINAISGQSVALLGYPAGLEGLLARVDDRERWGLTRVTLRAALNELAQREQIRPQSTQGHIGDITPHRLVYDARTSEGGSGGPVFTPNGKVIGINQAVMPNTPSSFGIPIRYGIELIQKHQAAQRSKAEPVIPRTATN